VLLRRACLFRTYSLLPKPMAVLVAYLDRLGYYEPAATISGFTTSPFVADYYPGLGTGRDEQRRSRRVCP
jgi:hypothetical protein